MKPQAFLRGSWPNTTASWSAAFPPGWGERPSVGPKVMSLEAYKPDFSASWETRWASPRSHIPEREYAVSQRKRSHSEGLRGTLTWRGSEKQRTALMGKSAEGSRKLASGTILVWGPRPSAGLKAQAKKPATQTRRDRWRHWRASPWVLIPSGMSIKPVETSDDLQGYLGPLLEEVPRSYVYQLRKLAEHYRKLASGVPSRLRSTTVSRHNGFVLETYTNRISAITETAGEPAQGVSPWSGWAVSQRKRCAHLVYLGPLLEGAPGSHKGSCLGKLVEHHRKLVGGTFFGWWP